jgi:ABC-type glutathione transport system ATPase component
VLGLSAGRVRGRIRWRGRELVGPGAPRRARAGLAGREIAMVFQEPATALDPLFRVGDQIAEVLRVHVGLRGRALRARVHALLEAVELPDPARIARRWPHQLSGGQRQRVLIAMATAAEPALVLADEPTSALDVTVERQILDLLERRVRSHGAALCFITHDLALVADRADRICVMADGCVVEDGPTAAVLARPLHPATVALVRARSELAGLLDPGLVPRTGRFGTGAGAGPESGPAVGPDMGDVGCAHRARCPIGTGPSGECGRAPHLSEVEPGHRVACHFPGEERVS